MEPNEVPENFGICSPLNGLSVSAYNGERYWQIADWNHVLILTGPEGRQIIAKDWGQLAELLKLLARTVPLQNFLTPEEWEAFRQIHFQA